MNNTNYGNNYKGFDGFKSGMKNSATIKGAASGFNTGAALGGLSALALGKGLKGAGKFGLIGGGLSALVDGISSRNSAGRAADKIKESLMKSDASLRAKGLKVPRHEFWSA